MASLNASIKWATNAADQAKKMAEFKDSIVATTAGAEKLANTLSGGKLIQSANNLAAAIDKVGGVSKLTIQEQERWLPLLEKTIAKMDALGGSKAPMAMQEMAAQMRANVDAANKLPDNLSLIEKVQQRVAAETGNATSRIKEMALGYFTGEAAVRAFEEAGRLALEFLKGSIDEALEADQVQRKLTAALQAQGQAFPEVLDFYDSLASKYQQQTIYSDELIKTQETMLVQVGNVMPSQMDKALNAVTNLASGLRIDLGAATMMVSKAFEDHFTALQKAGVQIDATRAQAEGMDYIIGQINSRFGGQAQADVQSYAGQVEQVKNAYRDLQEQLGKVVIDTGALQTVMFAAKLVMIESQQELSGLIHLYDILSTYPSNPTKGALLFWAYLKDGPEKAKNAAANYTGALDKYDLDAKKMSEGQRKYWDDVAKSIEESGKKASEAAKREAEEWAKAVSAITRDADQARYAHEQYNAAVDETYYILNATWQLQAKVSRTLPNFGPTVEMVRDLGSVLDDLDPGWRAIGQVAGRDFGHLNAQLTTSKSLLDSISANFTGSAKSVASFFSSSIGLADKYVSAMQDATDKTTGFIDQNKAAAASSAASASAAILVFGALASVAANAISDSQRINKAIKETRDQLTALGQTPVTLNTDAKSVGLLQSYANKAGNPALKALQDQLADVNEAMNKYGLSAEKAGSDTEVLARSVAKAVTDFETLSKAGFTVGQISTGAASQLNGFLMSALTTGQKLPAALKPYLEDLIRTGQLTDDVKNKMLGISPVPWKEAAAAAEAWGISVDDLGMAFQQAKLNDQAETLAKQFSDMLAVGTTVDQILSHMSSDMSTNIQDMITKAMKLGMTIPESMKPLLQAMVDAGKLTDENGDKLTDLSRINFAKDLNSQIEDLIGKMSELIDKFDEAARAAAGIGTAGASATPPSSSNNRPPKAHTGAFVTAAGIQRFHDGAASVARLLQFPALAANEVPAILQAGEAVLQKRAVDALGRGRVRQLNSGIDSVDGGASQVVTIAPVIHVHPTPGMSEQQLADKVGMIVDRNTGGVRTKLQRLPRVS